MTFARPRFFKVKKQLNFSWNFRRSLLLSGFRTLTNKLNLITKSNMPGSVPPNKSASGPTADVDMNDDFDMFAQDLLPENSGTSAGNLVNSVSTGPGSIISKTSASSRVTSAITALKKSVVNS